MDRTLEHGFRYDPMEHAQAARTLAAALVRRDVLRYSQPGDDKLISDAIEAMLGDQNDDGTLSDDPNHRYQFTAEALIRLAEMGVDPKRPEIERAVDVILRERDDDTADPIGIYTVRALLLLDRADAPEARQGLEALVARKDEWSDMWQGCPWTPVEHLATLWCGRDVLDTTELVEATLATIAENLNAAGCYSYKDPWGYLRIASLVDSPAARKIAEQQVPMILRGQQPDGGWGPHTTVVFRALVTHGLLDPLLDLSPLPSDWTITRAIHVPVERPSTLAFDGANLWTRDCETDEAVCISPIDGAVVRKVKLPAEEPMGIGAWGDMLGVTDKAAKRVIQFDPETGAAVRDVPLQGMEWINGFTEFGGKLWVADGFLGCVVRIDPAALQEAKHLILPGPCPLSLAAADDGVWHIDIWAPAIMKCDAEGRLLAWGEKPFDGACDGLAWDGNQLWALDGHGGRICAIEPTAEAGTDG